MKNKIFSPSGDEANVIGRRWLPAQSALTIPPFSLVQANGGPLEDGIDLIKPATKDMNYYGATGPTEISSTKRGEVSWSWPCWVKYTGTAPAVGGEVGVAASSHTVTTAGKGYRVLVVDTGGLLVLLVPFGDGAGTGGTGGTGACGDTQTCAEIFWSQGAVSGSYFIQMTCLNDCYGFYNTRNIFKCINNTPGAFGELQQQIIYTCRSFGTRIDYIFKDCLGVTVTIREDQLPFSPLGHESGTAISIDNIIVNQEVCSGVSTFPSC